MLDDSDEMQDEIEWQTFRCLALERLSKEELEKKWIEAGLPIENLHKRMYLMVKGIKNLMKEREEEE